MSTDGTVEVQPLTNAEPPKGPARPSTPKMIEPDPKDIVVVGLNTASLDARVAAWVVYKAARQYQVPVAFTDSRQGFEDLTDRHLILLGRPAKFHVEHWGPKVKSAILFDVTRDGEEIEFPSVTPPLPFRKWQRQMPYKVVSMAQPGSNFGLVLRPGASVAQLAYDFFKADRVGFEKQPVVIASVADYVTGARKIRDAASICADLETYDFDLRTLDKLADALEIKEKRDMIVAAGEAVARYRAQHGDSAL